MVIIMLASGKQHVQPNSYKEGREVRRRGNEAPQGKQAKEEVTRDFSRFSVALNLRNAAEPVTATKIRQSGFPVAERAAEVRLNRNNTGTAREPSFTRLEGTRKPA